MRTTENLLRFFSFASKDFDPGRLYVFEGPGTSLNDFASLLIIHTFSLNHFTGNSNFFTNQFLEFRW
ncbi:MAG: hypothetical protein JNM00_08645 [Flavobacteriales bacterium]|nr:hypothetical protein [Flavobacteriales bacterium]